VHDEDECEGAKIYLGGLDHSDRQSRGAEVGVDEKSENGSYVDKSARYESRSEQERETPTVYSEKLSEERSASANAEAEDWRRARFH
jgi:hypothetical protein